MEIVIRYFLVYLKLMLVLMLMFMFIPRLINNCSTWIGITPSLEQKLEGLQEQFIRLMLEVPISTPKAALRAETGMLSMKHRVWIAKLNMVLSLRRSNSI